MLLACQPKLRGDEGQPAFAACGFGGQPWRDRERRACRAEACAGLEIARLRRFAAPAGNPLVCSQGGWRERSGASRRRASGAA